MRAPTLACIASLVLGVVACSGDAEEKPEPRLEIRKGDHICLIGNTLAEREQYFGHFETALHTRFPDYRLVVRNLARSGDEVKLRIRSGGFGSPGEHLTRQKADVILAFFGFNESFGGSAGLPGFEQELRDWIAHTLTQKYNGRSAPRIALVSPIAFENLQDPNLPDGTEANQNLQAYAAVMQKVAADRHIVCVDLFTPTLVWMQEHGRSKGRLTFNGVHLTERGYEVVGPMLDAALFGAAPSGRVSDASVDRDALRKEILERNDKFFLDHRAVNGVHIYGRRKNPYGTKSFPQEFEKLRQMTALRDKRVWDVARGRKVAATVDDASTKKLAPMPTNFTRPIRYLPAEDEAAQKFTLPKGYAVNLFASEATFPELKNPVQLTFDDRGRLWVAVMPSYPQLLPGERYHDKLLVLADTNGDGRADKRTVFADDLHLPTGFELWDGGVLVAQEPNLLFLKDTDGDGKADLRRIVLHGFDAHDSHHAFGAFTYGPGGGIYMHEGIFLHSAIETPYGPQRVRDGCIYRYEPRTHRVETFISFGFYNPWGSCFDDWGQHFLTDASDGANYYGTPISHRLPYDIKHKKNLTHLTPHRVRPTSGCEIVSSRHFPPEVQGDYLVCNCIGFLGIKQHQVIEKGSGWTAKHRQNLIQSTDPNFRPVDLEFGPDGALYLADWHNALIGHMQHSLRDPNRDHDHGRIWRITYPSRPLLTPAKMNGASIVEQIELLKRPQYRARYRVRRALADRKTEDVVAALAKWTGELPQDERRERNLLEALWVYQHHNHVEPELLRTLLSSKDVRVRTAAARVLRFWADRLPDALQLFERLAADGHSRVRLEAVVSASTLAPSDGASVVLTAMQKLGAERDEYLERGIEYSLKTLMPSVVDVMRKNPKLLVEGSHAQKFLLAWITPAQLQAMPRSKAIYERLVHDAGVAAAQRKEGLKGLAAENKTTALQELLKAIRTQARKAGPSLSDLSGILAAWSDFGTETTTEGLVKLLRETQSFAVKRAAYAAMIGADNKLTHAFAHAKSSIADLRACLAALALVKDDKLLRDAWPRVAALTSKPPASLVPAGGKRTVTTGRYVRVELPQQGTLTLAEVQVFVAGQNVAKGRPCKQSSVAWDGVAGRAVDGKTDGRWSAGASTHTREDQRAPWWEVDLGEAYPIDRLVVFNRTDGDLGRRLHNFTIRILHDNRETVWVRDGNQAPKVKVTFALDSDPRAVIQRAAVDALALLPGDRVKTLELLLSLAESVPEAQRRQQHFVHLLTVCEPILYRGASGQTASRTRFEKLCQSLPISLRPRGMARLMALGKKVYHRESHCVTCHQEDGRGLPRTYPTLRQTPWVTGSPERVIKIVLHGMEGPITVGGEHFDGSNVAPMTAFGSMLTNEEIAAVVTFVRNSWGNEAAPVLPETVQRVRQATATRKAFWTEKELLK